MGEGGAIASTASGEDGSIGISINIMHLQKVFVPPAGGDSAGYEGIREHNHRSYHPLLHMRFPRRQWRMR